MHLTTHLKIAIHFTKYIITHVFLSSSSSFIIIINNSSSSSSSKNGIDIDSSRSSSSSAISLCFTNFRPEHYQHLEASLQRQWPTAGAVWDIWAADDEPRLTAFLWRVAAEEAGDDAAQQLVGHPIHDANIYLSAGLRRRLWEEEGVRGYRFVQVRNLLTSPSFPDLP